MEKLLELPPLAVITFSAVLALIFGVRYLGLWQVSTQAQRLLPALRRSLR